MTPKLCAKGFRPLKERTLDACDAYTCRQGRRYYNEG
jgi:hypothetical protein